MNSYRQSAGKLGVALFALVLAFACSRQPTKTIKIGALLSLTGSGANYGKSLQQGIEVAREDINQSGGIGGKNLEVVYEDSQGDAKTGVSAFNKLVSIDHVPVVIGSISSVVLAVAPIADQKHVVLVNSSAISPKICEQATNFLFSFMVSGADEARFMAQDYATKHKNEPIAVLYSNNASGIDTKDVFAKELSARGGRLATTEGYDLNASDFRTQLAKIKNSGARFGYLIAFSSSEFARILRQAKELNLQIRWYSYSGFETRETLELAGAAAEGVVYSYPNYSPSRSEMDAFQRRYRERYGSWADIYTVTSFDATKLLAEVMRNNGLGPEEIQKGLRSYSSHTGLFGPLTFQGPQCVVRQLTWKTVKNGQYGLVQE